MTRDEEYQRVIELLDYPSHGRPGSHLIVKQLAETEQRMTNRVNMSGRPWQPQTTSITTVVDQAEYTLPTGFGKAFFCYRDLGSFQLLPIAFTAYEHELAAQGYSAMAVPNLATVDGVYGEKLAFFRTPVTANGITTATPKVRIYPAPETAGIIYTIAWGPGWIDASSWNWSDTPPLPEWSHLRCEEAALLLVSKSEWDGLGPDARDAKRRDYKEDLKTLYEMDKDDFDTYIRNMDNDSIDSVGCFYDED